RTADRCATLRAAGHEEMIAAKTGLVLDPYFSATKLAWMLDEIPDARRRAEAGELAFGTVDTWLIWHLTRGAAHVTDVTNAARTMLFDIHSLEWCEDILSLFNIPRAVLPNVLDCDAHFGTTAKDVIGAEIPIRAVAGDQQAATIGQACFDQGMAKVTYGTGCFALMNTGATAVPSKNKLLTTIAYRMDGQTAYALEGSIYIAGAVVQWLRDGLGIIASAAETQEMAKAADQDQAITLVPAFTGLAAPYWNSECRGAVFGLSRNTGPNELVRAALQSVGLQTRDLMEAMAADTAGAQTGQTVLRVDGGMSASDYTLQYVADILNAPVDRPTHLETTARGVAWLAGYKAGLYPDKTGFAKTWAKDRQFAPKMNADTRNSYYARWQKAVAATIAAEA
ncbi:MAG: glycerol kinase GlpK, partial [Rhodobacteraceae bacterium]|nr:glycerol kinase GlpK [Paracoccaceae bacterium]